MLSFLLGGPSSTELATVNRRLSRIEAKLDAIMASLSIKVEAAADGNDDIRDLALSGRVIDAIKLYRARTGSGLKDSKDVIEAFVRGDGPLAL